MHEMNKFSTYGFNGVMLNKAKRSITFETEKKMFDFSSHESVKIYANKFIGKEQPIYRFSIILFKLRFLLVYEIYDNFVKTNILSIIA